MYTDVVSISISSFLCQLFPDAGLLTSLKILKEASIEFT